MALVHTSPRKRDLWGEVARRTKGSHRQGCVHSSGARSRPPAKPCPCLGSCGFHSPLSFAWSLKARMELQTPSQTQHQATTSHFSVCLPHSPPSARPDSHKLSWVCPKDSLTSAGHMEDPRLGGEKFHYTILPSPLRILPEMREVNQSPGGNGEGPRLSFRAL